MKARLLVFGALVALLLDVWGVCFIAHVHREQFVIDQVAFLTKQLRIKSDASLMALSKAARNSMYDPFWFLDGAP